LPIDERLTLDGCLRQIDFLDTENRGARGAAGHAVPEILRLMTVPGVNLHTAAAFMASVGEIRRFGSARQLVGYPGLDPEVRQSGNAEARHGRISKAGSSLARGMLGEAARSVAQTPGPLRAFFERIRARELTGGLGGSDLSHRSVVVTAVRTRRERADRGRGWRDRVSRCAKMGHAGDIIACQPAERSSNPLLCGSYTVGCAHIS
jgi:transposase